MRQTLEQAAFEYAQNVALNDLLRSSRQACEDAFKAGAKWQKKQVEAQALHVFGALQTALNNMDAVKASFNDIPKGGDE